MRLTKNYKSYSNNGVDFKKCEICGKELLRPNKTIPTCSLGSCRGKWYRLQNLKDILIEVDRTGDFSTIGSLKISTIRGLGFDVSIKSRLPKHDSGNVE